MPLNVDNFVQDPTTGSFDSTSGSATLGTAATAGSCIIVVAGLALDGTSTAVISTPAGFQMAFTVPGSVSRSKPFMFVKQTAAGGETSVTLAVTGGAAQQVCWAAFEVSNIDVLEDFALSGVNGIFLQNTTQPFGSATLVSSRSTDVSSASESYSAMAMAVHLGVSADTTTPVLSGHTNGFQEVAAVNRANATRAMAMSVSVRPSYTTETFECTVSTSPNSYLTGSLVAFTAADAKHAVRVQACSGAEIGTATSITNTSIVAADALAPFDGVVGSPAATTSTPRTGSYCWELSSSAAAECLTWLSVNNLDEGFGIGTKWGCAHFNVYFPTSLPGADVELFSAEAGSLANGVTVWFRSSSSKIGVKIGTGTEQLSDATVTANQWIGLDLYYDASTTTHTCSWMVDYNSARGDATAAVAQTQATASGMTSAAITTVRFGWSTSKTATVRYDDLVWSRMRKNYPIGEVNIWPLKVDPAGTPTVSGTTANFQSFSSNGTGAAFNAATVRNALLDMPPTIGASADGLMQINAAGSDYVEVPMETRTAAPDDVIRAVRWYLAPWAASGTAATWGASFYDGVNDLAFVVAGDHGQDNAALMWICRQHQQSAGNAYLLDQAKIDALAFRFGRSTDATPDVGVHSVLAELVLQPARVFTMTEAEDGTFRVYVKQDGDTGAIASLVVTTPPGSRGATLLTTIGGSDATDYVPPDTMWTKTIGASSLSDVTAVGLSLDPT